METRKSGFSFPLILTISAYIFLIAAASSEECKRKDACSCEFTDGTEINIHKIFPNEDPQSYLSASKDNYTFYYHGCSNIHYNVDPMPGLNYTSRDCNSMPASICVFNATASSFDVIANTSGLQPLFKENSKNPGTHNLIYSGSQYSTIITLVCVPNFQEHNLMIRAVSGNEIELELYSPYACRTHDMHHYLSTGSKLLIMFFTFLLIYLVGGMLLAYTMKGARGAEMIPNLDFWMSLPGLVKDGCIFIMGGCSSRMVSTAETYDQI